jgi:hypothetical protein
MGIEASISIPINKGMMAKPPREKPTPDMATAVNITSEYLHEKLLKHCKK